MHNKTPNALLFNSGAKILCSVKCVRKPDAQTQFFSMLSYRFLKIFLISGFAALYKIRDAGI